LYQPRAAKQKDDKDDDRKTSYMAEGATTATSPKK
jgi:hypothetical protein